MSGTSFLCGLRTPVGSLRLLAGFPDLRLLSKLSPELESPELDIGLEPAKDVNAVPIFRPPNGSEQRGRRLALSKRALKIPEEVMNQTIAIDCPAEILVSLHMNAEGLAGFMKQQAAIALFREGRLSSGTAATWLGIPRVTFLLRAMESGAVLLEDSADDLARETSLLDPRS